MYFSQILFEHALRSSARAACPVVAAALSGHATMVHGFAVTLTDGHGRGMSVVPSGVRAFYF